jgi:hypothetical protein
MTFCRMLFLLVLLLLVSCRSSENVPDSVPPPQDPAAEPTPVNIDGASATLKAELWRDLMPSVPPSGPPLYMALTVTLDNSDSPRSVAGWLPVLCTAYLSGTKTAVGSVGIRPATEHVKTSVEPGEVVAAQFVPDLPPHTGLDWPLDVGDKYYVRLMVKQASGRSVILTSPNNAVAATY